MVAVARGEGGDDHSAIISQSLVAVIEQDKELAEKAKQRALKYVDGPIRTGHVTFGTDLALAAIAYDHGFQWWTSAERERFHSWVNRTVEANTNSETHVFHNGWYGYKNWGVGLAGYASYHENPHAPRFLKELEKDFMNRAAPALELAGNGGAWAEGYYTHYWLYEWLVFCDVALRCEAVDYHAMAPSFFTNRAVASMFEMYPGISEYNSRRPVPMGDGGGRNFGGDRDKALSARRMLVNRYRNDPAHQAVHSFNETTPRSAVGDYAYMDFLWHDATVPKGDLRSFRLSHFTPGAGHVYARSSWQEDATYFFFKATDRFTAHQHLDAGHFDIFRMAELAGDGGHYDDFGSRHDVNYHLRTIAHSTLLVSDPQEKWPAIRAGKVTGNDGGQHHNWRHHNGALSDVEDWKRQRQLHDVVDMLAFEDTGDYVYAAADLTQTYSPGKLKRFTRQVVFVRPATIVIFDQVEATRAELQKTWLLQAMRIPGQNGRHLVIESGKARLFVQSLLPETNNVRLVSGPELYSYGGETYAPKRKIGDAPECRIEISPGLAAASDFFLTVLTTADATVQSIPEATVRTQGDQIELHLPQGVQVNFDSRNTGGNVRANGSARHLSTTQ